MNKMRTLKILKEFDPYSYGSPSRLILADNETGVRWNGDTKKDLYGDFPVLGCAKEFAFTLVSELDQELGFIGDGLTIEEKARFHKQLLKHLEDYPD